MKKKNTTTPCLSVKTILIWSDSALSYCQTKILPSRWKIVNLLSSFLLINFIGFAIFYMYPVLIIVFRTVMECNFVLHSSFTISAIFEDVVSRSLFIILITFLFSQLASFEKCSLRETFTALSYPPKIV